MGPALRMARTVAFPETRYSGCVRLTFVLFLATAIIASTGVYLVNARVEGGDYGDETTRPVPREAPPLAKLPAENAQASVINVTGCFDSEGKCRCIDERGHRIPVSEISDADCRKVLEIGPR